MSRSCPSHRGATLIEIMISMAVVLVGMLAMFGVLRSSIVGSATSQKMSQAQVRAATILESIRQAPQAALTCLSTSSPSTWSTCEATCQQALTFHNADACVYSMDAFAQIKGPDATGANVGQAQDRHRQQYALYTDATKGSFVRVGGTNGAIMDAQIVIGWNDDGTAPANAASYDHTIALRTGIAP